jgi:hypothetical protein
VDNWSLGLDFMIMLLTVHTVMIRALRAVRSRLPGKRTVAADLASLDG